MHAMKLSTAILTVSSLLFAGFVAAQATPPNPAVPLAGRTTVGVTLVEMDAVIAGWSVQRDILKKAVVNDKKEKIGTVTDIVIATSPDAKLPSATYAIIGVGGFLGMGKHDVAIPMQQLQLKENTLMLPGGTKDTLKALPAFEYRRK